MNIFSEKNSFHRFNLSSLLMIHNIKTYIFKYNKEVYKLCYDDIIFN
jgi:hypothetical protein